MTTEETIPIPESCACAQCRRPIDALTSFGLSTPVDSDIAPVDFCSLYCLGFWTNATIARRNRPFGSRIVAAKE